jgi:hypothetical protein
MASGSAPRRESRFGGFRAREAEVLPAGSAQLPMLSLFPTQSDTAFSAPNRILRKMTSINTSGAATRSTSEPPTTRRNDG